MPRISCSTSISSDVRSKPCMDDETTQNPTSWVQLWGSNDFQGASLCAGHAFRRPYPWRQVFPEHAETCNSRNSEAHRNHFCHEHQWLKHQRLKFCLRQISMATEWESYIQTKPAHRAKRWMHPFLTYRWNCQKEQRRWCQVSEKTPGKLTSCW